MYSSDSSKSIKLFGSPSFLYNNLTVSQSLSSTQAENLCFVRLHEVYIAQPDGDAIKVPIAKSKVYQVAYIEVQGRCVLAIATSLGIQLWSVNGDQLVFNYPLNLQSSYADEEDDDERFMKGVASCMDFLCVGCSNGNIVIFNCSGKGDWNNFPISYNLRTDHQVPISAMSATDTLLVTGNDTGTIMAHSLESHFCCVFTFPGCGSPCTCVCQTENLICAGFATGHLRLFRSDIKELVFEITAHTRAVTGMSLNHAHTELAVCSKDQHINVWSLPSFESRETSDISLLYADCAENKICTGIAYLSNEQLCVAFYDEEELQSELVIFPTETEECQIVSGDFGPVDYLYCRYSFHIGDDWNIASGLDTGLSQTSCKNLAYSDEQIIWNFPVDVSFNTTNVYGWPRIAVSVYGIDYFGRDVIRGYGSALVPISGGQHRIEIDMFVPLATSFINDVISWIMGNPPEFFDSKFVCQSEGREVTRVRRTGSVAVNLNVVTRGMQTFGYNTRETRY